MTGFFGRAGFLVVLFGEVSCILGASAPAAAQAAGAQVHPSEAVLSTRERPFTRPSHVETFAALLREIGADDLAAREEAITGEKQLRVDWTTVNRSSIGLSDEQWSAACAILLDGGQRVSAWGDAMQDALGWKDGQFASAASAVNAAREKTQFDALSERGDAIVEETMTTLQQTLGAEAYARLDAYVYRREGGGILNPGPIRKGPIETARVTPILTRK